MKLSALPILNPDPLLFDYDESQVTEFVQLYASDIVCFLTSRGIRADEIPDDFFEAYVFFSVPFRRNG